MKTEIGTDIEKAAWYLRKNFLIAIPTETVYGLAGNALSEQAILEIFKVKKRPSFEPINIQVDSIKKIYNYIDSFPEPLLNLANQLLPGPLTLILTGNQTLPSLLSAGLSTIGVRIPDHKMAVDLLALLNFPLAVPSANVYGYFSPTSAELVYEQLDGMIPYILDGGECRFGMESTVLGYENGELIIYRQGAILLDQIKKLLPNITINQDSMNLKLKQYFTKTVFKIGDPITHLSDYDSEEIGILSFNKLYNQIPIVHQRRLSEGGNLDEAVKKLFKFLIELDNLNLKIIIAERVPNEGLGLMINDKLEKTSQSSLSH
jgi:L-threonylcarbamoyladenylate synthase